MKTKNLFLFFLFIVNVDLYAQNDLDDFIQKVKNIKKPEKLTLKELRGEVDKIDTLLTRYTNTLKSRVEIAEHPIYFYYQLLLGYQSRFNCYIENYTMNRDSLCQRTERQKYLAQVALYKDWLYNYIHRGYISSVFSDSTAKSDDIKKQFLQKLSDALLVFMQDDTVFISVTPLLDNLFIIKRPEMQACIQQLKSLSPERKAELVFNTTDSTDFRAQGELLDEIFSRYKEHLENLLQFLEFVSFISDTSHSAEYFQTLESVLRRIKDDQLAVIMLKEVEQNIRDPKIMQRQTYFSLFEDQFFKTMDNNYLASERIEKIILSLEKFEKNKKRLLLLKAHTSGNLNHVLPGTDESLLDSLFAAELQEDYEVDLRNDISSQKYYIPDAKVGKNYNLSVPINEYFISWIYEIFPNTNTIEFHVSLYDGTDELILAGINRMVKIHDSDEASEILKTAFRDMKDHLNSLMSAYMHFDALTTQVLPRYINRDKLKAYLYANSYFDITFESGFLQYPWLSVEGVYLEPFHFGKDSIRIALDKFYNRLNNELEKNYDSFLPVLDGSAKAGRIITIYGKPVQNIDNQFDILVAVNRNNPLVKIRLSFSDVYDGYSTEEYLEYEYYIQMIVQIIDRILGVNKTLFKKVINDTVRVLTQKLNFLKSEIQELESNKFLQRTPFNVVPSLVFAGSSQIFNSQFQNGVNKTLYKYGGSALMLCQLASLGAALYYNNEGIGIAGSPDAANSKLEKRDNFYQIAAGTLLVNAVWLLVEKLKGGP